MMDEANDGIVIVSSDPPKRGEGWLASWNDWEAEPAILMEQSIVVYLDLQEMTKPPRLQAEHDASRRKVSAVLSDPNALQILNNIVEESALGLCERCLPFAKTMAANLCEIGTAGVYPTEAGKRLVGRIGSAQPYVFDRVASLETDAFQRKFARLTSKWQEETAYLSSPSAIAEHPAYQEIIGMGKAALPLILRDLRKTQAQWFFALRAISGKSPVPLQDRGNVSAMTRAWLEWGADQRYV